MCGPNHIPLPLSCIISIIYDTLSMFIDTYAHNIQIKVDRSNLYRIMENKSRRIMKIFQIYIPKQ